MNKARFLQSPWRFSGDSARGEQAGFSAPGLNRAAAIFIISIGLVCWSRPAPAQDVQLPGWNELAAGLALEYRTPPAAVQARDHYLAAARAGSREAWLGLVRLHEPGGSLWAGLEIWRDHLLAAARAGWAEAAFTLAETLEETPRPDLDPIAFYLQAAAAGHPAAAHRLAVLYDEGSGGRPREASQAVFWLTVAATRGDPEAALELGRFYLQKDLETAAAWLKKANTAEASYWLGEIHLKNQRFSEAAGSFARAAEAGRPEAHLALGRLYLDNDLGRPDPRAALRHFKMAADLPEGAYRLAQMFLAGLATPKDALTGAFWLHRAAERGHAQAEIEYDKLISNFTPGQRKRLERMIEEGLAPTTRTLDQPPAP